VSTPTDLSDNTPLFSLILHFLTSKTCYIFKALNISCYVGNTMNILLFSFPLQDLFLSTLFFVSELYLGS
jgi:hypothetical protein